MIANQFKSACREIPVNMRPKYHDFSLIWQFFCQKMAEINNYSNPQKLVRNVSFREKKDWEIFVWSLTNRHYSGKTIVTTEN